MTLLETLLRRERIVVLAGLIGLTAAAWFYLWRGAGMGMTALQMTQLALFPHTQPEPMAGMEMPAISWLTVVAMWWIMMIAMMVPSAAPLVLLYLRALHHPNARAQRSAVYASSAWLITGYLSVWLMFSIMAATLQAVLQQLGLISGMMMWSRSAALSAAVLAAAGIYQLTPLKRACLTRCRGPLSILKLHWRPGSFGAFRIGVEHGAWCVSCCWVLMLLLFVGGVMNVVWIALIASLILIEKITPFGDTARRASGIAFLAWSAATLVAPIR